MRIELDWDERNLLADLLNEERKSVASGSTVYNDNAEILEIIDGILQKVAD